MLTDEIRIKYIGGPTAVLEVAGLRFITDPTFDPKNTSYDTGMYVLHKLNDPLAAPGQIGKIDYVLLSHDHHFDNLDNNGRKFLSTTDKVFTTPIGAQRLGTNAIGLKNWETREALTKDNRTIEITGTPCRHGPVGGDRGPVTGFILNFKGEEGSLYISGDTVMYEGVAEVIRRFDIRIAILFMGAAVVKEVGKDHLTMTIDESIEFAKLSSSMIIPLHFEDWAHFTESKNEILEKYKKAGISDRLEFAEPI